MGAICTHETWEIVDGLPWPGYRCVHCRMPLQLPDAMRQERERTWELIVKLRTALITVAELVDRVRKAL